MSDYDMLEFASDISIAINPSDKGPDSLMELAEQHGWLIQCWER